MIERGYILEFLSLSPNMFRENKEHVTISKNIADGIVDKLTDQEIARIYLALIAFKDSVLNVDEIDTKGLYLGPNAKVSNED